ncbi:MAG: hypothetical protein ATN35_06735 [Epulopiscium sp. Nele67-Bin004]|nr:MAG: hypothetical protein ATN35_06735 [Epulopiscium sp. Nele67-Bin004]
MGDTKIILAARYNSSRLPKKALKEILGLCILEIAIKRLRKTKNSTAVIVATTEHSFPYFKDIIKKTNALYFIGSETDVLQRYTKAAEAYNVSTVVRATGDNPLVAIEALDAIVEYHKNKKADLSHFVNLPYGSGVEVIEYDALKKACDSSDDSHCHEHITQYHYQNENMFNIHRPLAPEKWSMKDLHITVDTIEEYEYVKSIFEMYNDIVVGIDENDVNNFSEFDKKRMKKGVMTMKKMTLKKNNIKVSMENKYKKLVVTAAGIGIAIIGGTPIVASHMFGNLADELNVSQQLANYTTVVGQSVTHDGVSITLDEVILDGNTLTVLTTIQSSEPIDNYSTSYNAGVYINGTHCPSGGGYTEPINDYTNRMIIDYRLDDSVIGLDDDVDIEIKYGKSYANSDIVDPTTWDFAFTTVADSLLEDTEFYPLDLEFVLDDNAVVTITHMTSNVAGTKIYYSTPELTHRLDIDGVDNFGNSILTGSGSYSNEPGVGHTKLKTVVDGTFVGNLLEDATSLTLNVSFAPIPAESGRMPEPTFVSDDIVIELK